MMKKIFFALLLLGATGARAQEPAALKAWKDQKYSMFIHWGAIYSTLGGVWEGKPVTRGYSEQIQSHAGIYSDVYADVANRFNPAQWNPDSIVLLAKAAGMKSVVITSKHHDGFCMFKSAYTDYNVVDATPYKRDVLKELADACRRHGLKFGLYFSLIDWHFPQAYPISSSNSDPITPEHHAYNLQQVRELMTNYGPVSEIWFDMGSLTAQQSRELATLVHSLQPGCMVSGRLGNDAGDFCVMGDNQYPDYKIASPWQTPASVYDETWGYRSWQQHGKAADKADEKLRGLIKVVSRGGNFLLNIGPRGDGSVVDFEKEVLLLNGTWLQQNGDAIYGAGPNPFDTTFAWGEVTAKKGQLFLHLLDVPADGNIYLPGFHNKITDMRLVAGNVPVEGKVNAAAGGLHVKLPASAMAGKHIPVLVLNYEGELDITPVHLLKAPVVLDRSNAVSLFSFSGADYESYYRSEVGETWAFTSPKNKKITLRYSEAEKGRTVALELNGSMHELPLTTGKPVPLKNELSQLQWGPVYTTGAMRGGIGGSAGDLHQVNVTKPFAGGQSWTLQPDFNNDALHTFAGGRSTNYYVLQEVTAPKDGSYLLGFSSGDGIQVFVNGEEQLIHNNPERGTTQSEVLLVQLKKGKNQLVVKLYTRFAKELQWAINRQVPQQLYEQPTSLEVKGGSGINRITIRDARAVSPHRNLRMPDLSLYLQAK
ncbi:alpha-L-fucosidase [Chitinophaga jiangningensis]|uniref:alpha-L-fucosidase n=1 Tax=Chitinophaga jiangningensis TaxID=1419482 RepID=A0A1M7KDB0_9BACT|nr:alpha-L-fucosidase [Chitinophaga jiangningensis]SHM63288.1 alpha-L-fucosidase [Chitinophaga jiangningensis]